MPASPTPASPTPPLPTPRPFLELRVGGVHLVVQQIPYRLLALASAAAGLFGGTAWITGR